MNEKEIIISSKDISLVKGKAADFCTIWPPTKKGLEILRDVIKNPVVKGIIGVVIAAGDAVSKEICK
jgi:hypothetical protein